jgi:tetratricopeptide (TPR) repeat protein
MSFLKKLFGPKDPIDEMRQSHAQQNWAGVLRAAKQLDRENIDQQTSQEITVWENEAGDALAALNIDEGLWAHKSGNLLRAREDFQLAIEQAKSPELSKRAKRALADLEKGKEPVEVEKNDDTPAVHASCNTCTPAATPHEEAGLDLDEEARMELLLATMSKELAERYISSCPEFRKAWLAAQDDNEKLALNLLKEVPEAERNSLYLFERGALQARGGQLKKARQDLQAALTLEPDLFQAFDALVEVLVAINKVDDLEKLLKQSIADDRFVGYGWARLAELKAHRGQFEPALAAGLKAIEEGMNDQGLFVLCAQLLERAERLPEAEALLKRLPGGGCGGGVNPMLAEYWLRRGQNLNKALESFKGALRQERDNPRWLLRIAQVYVAKGWHKEATGQVEQLMQQGNLPEQFKAEVRVLADQLQKK